MKHALGFSAVNQTLALVCSLLGCSVDNPGMSDPAKPVTWDGVVRTSPNSQGVTGDGGAGSGSGSGTFDPSKVYFHSQFPNPEDFDHHGLYGVENPTELLGELAYHVSGGYGGFIRPTDGALIYRHFDDAGNTVIAIFVPGGKEIPVDLPACAAAKPPVLPGRDWWLAPDTGEIMVYCSGGTSSMDTYAYPSGTSFQLASGYQVKAIGYNGTYLLETTQRKFFILNSDGSKIEVGKGPTDLHAVRATPTGFIFLQQSYPTEQDVTRWQVALDGSVVDQVLLPKPPPPLAMKGSDFLALDGAGQPLQILGMRVILRLTPGASEGEILYKGDLLPSGFITGP